MRVAGSVGQERPLYAGSTGKVLGAFQDEEEIRRRLMDEPLTPFTPRTITSPQALLEEYAAIRKQGYAISDGELNIETIGIGAPVRVSPALCGRPSPSGPPGCGWTMPSGSAISSW